MLMVGLSKIVELVQGHNKVPVQLKLHVYTLQLFFSTLETFFELETFLQLKRSETC